MLSPARLWVLPLLSRCPSKGVKQLPRLQPLLALQAASSLPPRGPCCWVSALSMWPGLPKPAGSWRRPREGWSCDAARCAPAAHPLSLQAPAQSPRCARPGTEPWEGKAELWLRGACASQCRQPATRLPVSQPAKSQAGIIPAKYSRGWGRKK